MRSKRLPPPEETLRRFAGALARQAGTDGWIVAREMDGHSNRGFVLEKEDQEIRFFAKLSQTERGFWGLALERADELIAAGEPLVLLTGAFEGFYIPANRLARLLPTFSKGSERPEYKVNENKVSKEGRFTTLIKLWTYLRPTARPPSAA